MKKKIIHTHKVVLKYKKEHKLNTKKNKLKLNINSNKRCQQYGDIYVSHKQTEA